MSLPEPLSPFEHYMLMDDSRDYPMCFAFRLTIDRLLDRARFEKAVALTLLRHPLLDATISERDQQLEWVPFTSNADHSVEWTEDELAEAVSPINLRTSPGLRIVVFENDETVRLTFQIHHACCDGLGACHFIDDVLIAYHNLFAESNPVEHRNVDPDRLNERTNISRQLSKWTLPWRIGLGVIRTAGFLIRQPIQLPGRTIEQAQTATGRNCDDADYSPDVLTTLRRESSGNATVNDRLLAIAFDALFAWNTEFGPNPSKSRSMRMGIPVSLRGSAHRNLPAANVVTITYLDRTRSQMADHQSLIGGINRQMAGIKSRKSGTFVRFMNFVGRSRLLRKLVDSERVFLSATFSNLGEVFVRSPLPRTENGKIRFANSILLDVDVQGPVRSTMPVFFAVFTYARRLKSCMAYDANTFSQADAGKLHSGFARRIQEMTVEPGVSRDSTALQNQNRHDEGFGEVTETSNTWDLRQPRESQRSQ